MFNKTWMFIGAHPDDIEIGAGGTMARISEWGGKIIPLVLTSPSELRVRECLDSFGIYSGVIKGVIPILGWKDGHTLCNALFISQLEKVLQKYKPDIIVTHYYNDTHQDHRVAYEITVSAARHYHTILMYDPIYPSGRSSTPFHANFNVSLSREHIEKKLEALRCHKSQLDKYGEIEWLNALEARAVYRGYESGNSYAESFEVVRLSI